MRVAGCRMLVPPLLYVTCSRQTVSGHPERVRRMLKFHHGAFANSAVLIVH